jgi:hypothetical protein
LQLLLGAEPEWITDKRGEPVVFQREVVDRWIPPLVDVPVEGETTTVKSFQAGTLQKPNKEEEEKEKEKGI